MPNIFISYSRKDSHIIDRLAARLERDCYEVFVDRDDITPGASWSQRIVDAINQADMFVVVLSNNSAKSDNVAKEIDLALTSQRRILPIALAPANRIALSEALEYELASRQMLDFYTGGFDRAYARLRTELPPLTKEEQKKCRRPLIIGRGWIAAGSLALAGVAIVAVMFFARGGLGGGGDAVIPTQPDWGGLPEATASSPRDEPIFEPMPTQPAEQMIPIDAPATLERVAAEVMDRSAASYANAVRDRDLNWLLDVYTGDALTANRLTIQQIASAGQVVDSQRLKSRILTVSPSPDIPGGYFVSACEVWQVTYFNQLFDVNYLQRSATILFDSGVWWVVQEQGVVNPECVAWLP